MQVLHSLCWHIFLNIAFWFHKQKQDSMRRDAVDSPKVARERIEHPPQMSPLHEMATSETKVNKDVVTSNICLICYSSKPETIYS